MTPFGGAERGSSGEEIYNRDGLGAAAPLGPR